MKFFHECKTIDEVKATYKKLAKQHHPDCGGDTETMQRINTEFSYAIAHILKGEDLSADEVNEQMNLSEEYRKVIEQIINMPGIIIEVVGTWIWVSANTFPVRKQLKEAGLFFAPKKVAWYYRADEYKTRGGKKTLDEIREKYGSETINKQYRSKVIQ